MYRLIFTFWLLLTVALPLHATELVDKCQECHGKDGNSKDSRVPTIAGFSAATIEDILFQFQDRERAAIKYTPEGGEESDMQTIARDLTEDEIEELAEYFSNRKYIPRAQRFDPSQVERGRKVHRKRCEKCHSNGGADPDDDAAILAGQGREYLEVQFDLIAKDERKIPRKMKRRFRNLSAEDRSALIEYYISQF